MAGGGLGSVHVLMKTHVCAAGLYLAWIWTPGEPGDNQGGESGGGEGGLCYQTEV